MNMMTAIIEQTVSITRSGQATVPKEIREQLEIVKKIPRPSELEGMGAGASDEEFREQPGCAPNASVKSAWWTITTVTTSERRPACPRYRGVRRSLF